MLMRHRAARRRSGPKLRNPASTIVHHGGTMWTPVLIHWFTLWTSTTVAPCEIQMWTAHAPPRWHHVNCCVDTSCPPRPPRWMWTAPWSTTVAPCELHNVNCCVNTSCPPSELLCPSELPQSEKKHLVHSPSGWGLSEVCEINFAHRSTWGTTTIRHTTRGKNIGSMWNQHCMQINLRNHNKAHHQMRSDELRTNLAICHFWVLSAKHVKYNQPNQLICSNENIPLKIVLLT